MKLPAIVQPSPRRPTSLVAGRRLACWALGFFLAAPPLRSHQDLEILIADLDRRIAEAPADPALYLRRGELRRLHQEWTPALDDYQRARDLDPRLAVVNLCLGKVLDELGLLAPALAAFDRYLLERPMEPEGLALRARVRWRLGDPAGAAEDFALAIEAHPAVNQTMGRSPPPELYLENARALAAGCGRADEAILVLDRGLARLGRPVTLALAALEIERERKRWPQALERLEELSRTSPRKEVWLARRGNLLEEAGRRDEARAAYRAALEALRTSPAVRRRTTAAQRLEAEVCASLERLSAEKRNRETP